MSQQNQRPRRAAIIGTGGIAGAHMTGFGTVKDRVEVVAAMDVDAGRVAEFAGKNGIPKTYTDLETLLAREKPDLVNICTPPGTHYALTVQCLEAGAWVLCEKPLCESLEQMDGLDAAERRTGRYVSSVFQWRFGAAGQFFHRQIRSNAFGKPLVGLCNTTWYRGLDYYAVPWRGKFATEVGGPTLIHGIHAMDFFLWLLGDFSEVRAMIGTLDRAVETEDVSMALVKFDSGAMASIVNSVLCPRQETHLRWDFQNATVECKGLYSYMKENWTFTPLPELKDKPEGHAWDGLGQIPDVHASHGAQISHLLDSMDRNERPLVSGNEARRIIEFISAMYKSAVTGQPVKRGSIVKGDPFYKHVAGTLALKTTK